VGIVWNGFVFGKPKTILGRGPPQGNFLVGPRCARAGRGVRRGGKKRCPRGVFLLFFFFVFFLVFVFLKGAPPKGGPVFFVCVGPRGVNLPSELAAWPSLFSTPEGAVAPSFSF